MIEQVLGLVVDRSRREIDGEFVRHGLPSAFVARNHGAVTSEKVQA